jgi:hypothetical protein
MGGDLSGGAKICAALIILCLVIVLVFIILMVVKSGVISTGAVVYSGPHGVILYAVLVGLTAALTGVVVTATIIRNRKR